MCCLHLNDTGNTSLLHPIPQRNILAAPAWQAEVPGMHLPVDLHAVSDALPNWQHVVGYEENDPRVIEKLQCANLRPILKQDYTGDFFGEDAVVVADNARGFDAASARSTALRRLFPDTRALEERSNAGQQPDLQFGVRRMV